MALEKSFFLLNDQNQNLLPVRRLNFFDFVTQSSQNSPKSKNGRFFFVLVVLAVFARF